MWGPSQTSAFNEIKAELTRLTTLALYSSEAPTKIRSDASAYGMGAILLQQHSDKWKPVAFASRSLTDTEKRYSQIEKEAWQLSGHVRSFQIMFWEKDSARNRPQTTGATSW